METTALLDQSGAYFSSRGHVFSSSHFQGLLAGKKMEAGDRSGEDVAPHPAVRIRVNEVP